jgi:hypothetical protein
MARFDAYAAAEDEAITETAKPPLEVSLEHFNSVRVATPPNTT